MNIATSKSKLKNTVHMKKAASKAKKRNKSKQSASKASKASKKSKLKKRAPKMKLVMIDFVLKKNSSTKVLMKKK